VKKRDKKNMLSRLIVQFLNCLTIGIGAALLVDKVGLQSAIGIALIAWTLLPTLK